MEGAAAEDVAAVTGPSDFPEPAFVPVPMLDLAAGPEVVRVRSGDGAPMAAAPVP
ncbi:MAG TPA: hypothetical protein VJQ79_08860 [Acidimicrobiia bacterium]|nr:hypothetical protein [Acidimicrobiia bacterium]